MKKIIILSLITTSCFFIASCTKEATSKINFQFKSKKDSSTVATIKGTDYSYEKIFGDIRDEIYDLEEKIYQKKMERLKSFVLSEYVANHPGRGSMSQEEFLNKKVLKTIKISNKEIDSFIKEKKIPAHAINDQVKGRVKDFLRKEKEGDKIEAWVAKQTKNSPIQVYIKKPERPRFEVDILDSPFLGSKNAKVTIIEFSDFQCPFCARGYKVMNQVKKKYGNKVKIVFKNFPLKFHNFAKGAAQAALCAREQGEKYFWKFHDTMFENQDKLKIADLKEQAKTMGLKTDKFNQCLDSQKTLPQVERDYQQGQKIHVKSTPTFLVNGELVKGAQPLEVFAEIIDKHL